VRQAVRVPLRVAVVGLGGMGRIQCAAWAEEGRAQLVAVCDRHREKAEPVARKFDCHAYTELDVMLEKEPLDLLSVCTAGVERGGDHFAPTMRALRAGVHVLVEKPLSNSLAEAEEMVAYAQQQDLVLAVNLNHRFAPAVARAKKWLDEGRVGAPTLMNAHLWVRNPADDTPYYHLIELHSHSIDLMRHLFGEIRQVQAFLMRPGGRKSWSNVSANVCFASGAVGCLQGSYDMSVLHEIERCEMCGTHGRIVVENVYESVSLFPHDSDEVVVVRNPILGGVSGFYDTVRYRIATLLDELAQGAPVSADGVDGLAALRVIHGIIRSFETGAVVHL